MKSIYAACIKTKIVSRPSLPTFFSSAQHSETGSVGFLLSVYKIVKYREKITAFLFSKLFLFLSLPECRPQSTYLYKRWNRVSVSAHSAGAYTATLLVMVNVIKEGGRAPPPSPAQANFTLMTECTPESRRYYSVYSVVSPVELSGGGGGRGARSYDHEKARPSISPSILPGVQAQPWTCRSRWATSCPPPLHPAAPPSAA